MTGERLPDCRPPRRDPSLTSGSSHPELLAGYLVVPPTYRLSTGRAPHDEWWRPTIGAVVLTMAGVFALLALKQDSSGSFEAHAQTREYTSTCAPWDAAATEAIVQSIRGARSFEQSGSVPSMCRPAMLDPTAGIMTRW